MKKRLTNLLLSFALIASTIICTSTPVMAAEANRVTPIVEGDRGNFANSEQSNADKQTVKEVVQTSNEILSQLQARSGIYGYAAGYISSSTVSFKVNATGSGTSSGGISVKTHGFSNNDIQIAVTVRRPDNTVAKIIMLKGNTMLENISFTNAPAGQYTVSAEAYGVSSGHVSVWIYSK